MTGEWLALGALAGLALAGAARRGSRNDCSGPFFHTTTWDRLQSIAEGGLEVGYGSRFGGWYQGHSRGRIFVGQGAWEAGEWFDKVSSIVEHNTEVKEPDDLPRAVAVMLRLDLDGLELHEDQAAKYDSFTGLHCSFYVTETIEPERIWFYDGTRWRPIDEWDTSDPMTAFRQWEFDSDDELDAYGERQEWIVFNTKNRVRLRVALLNLDWESGVFAPQRHNDPAAEQSWEDQKGSRNRTVAAVHYAHHGLQGSRNQPAFVVRSQKQGAALITHPEITANHRKALKIKPKHQTAVLVPCAGTKPFPESPSHKHGYLPALAGQKVDTYVVSEPLGVVPYAWSDTYPNNAYDFPPEHLKGRAFDLLVTRVGEWLDRVGSKYQRIVLALPAHHMRLVKKALVGRDLPIEEAGVGACKTDGACGSNVYRATHAGYSGWLGQRVAGSASRWWSWDEAWWKGPSKPVFIDGEGGRIYAVGQRMVLVFNSDLARADFDPDWRWTFKITHNKIDTLRMTSKMRARYRRGFPDQSAYRSTSDPMVALQCRVRSDLQSALDRARRSG